MKLFTKKSGLTSTSQHRLVSGFTLVEIMIVVGIIAILAGIFLVGSSRFRNAANVARVKADLQKIEALQEIYYTVHGEYATDYSDMSSDGNGPLKDIPKPPATAISYSTDTEKSCANGVESIGMTPDPYCLNR